MAKRRVQHKRPKNQARRQALAQSPGEPGAGQRPPSPFNLRPEPMSEERRELLEQMPLWVRALRIRQGVFVAVAMVGTIVALSTGGRVAGPAVGGGLLLGVGLAMWRADRYERRARERLGLDD